MSLRKSLELKFKAAFFGVCKSLLRSGREDMGRLNGKDVRKVLFLRPEKLGDTVISLPTFDGLKKAFPHIKIGLLASDKNRLIVQDDPRFDYLYIYRKNLIRDIMELLRIRAERFDAVLDMIWDDSMTTLFFSHLAARGKPCIGIGKKKTAPFYDYNYTGSDNQSAHIIDNTIKLLGAFGIDSETVSRYASPYLLPEIQARADKFLLKVRDGSNRRVVGYNLSAGSPTRIWSMEKSEELIRRIVSTEDSPRVLLIATPDDRDKALALSRGVADDRLFIVPENSSLGDVVALIARLDLLISPDTSLVHIARSFGVPVVGFYSNHRKNLSMWRPYGQETGAVASGDSDNIFNITADQAFEAYSGLIGNSRPVEK